jgi:hypothetical protein
MAAPESSAFRICLVLFGPSSGGAIQEADVQLQEWIRLAPMAAVFVVLGICGGCQRRPAPMATPADVAAAQQEAQHEVDQARIEARKDVKSVTKITGGDSKDVARAKITGAFDIAMAHADGDHKVAIARCLILEPSAQPSCEDQADSDYQTTVAKAKAIRLSQQ